MAVHLNFVSSTLKSVGLDAVQFGEMEIELHSNDNIRVSYSAKFADNSTNLRASRCVYFRKQP
ncbi:hypothetical protein VCR12J2_1030002 [Vibrio coralliirubri]|nr:hypothetical protein VCR4J2_340002 [Vibrio coralliirubri]CDT80128.1 hypothetical protein VCR12J2_1030002 [Vibrio coralliirubri]CDU14494.1 hypothetical protein VCR17J2_650070 [Vibrio coralliirubri]